MVELLACLLFVLVAGVSTALGLTLGAARLRLLRRLAPESTGRRPLSLDSRVVWRELVARIGTLVPASPRDVSQVKARLLRAGIRSPNASRYFHGARAIATIGFAAAAAGASDPLRQPRDRRRLAGCDGIYRADAVRPHAYAPPQTRHRKGLPNALDLMVVCVESGLDRSGDHPGVRSYVAHPEICDEFALMNLELRAGARAPTRSQSGRPHRSRGREKLVAVLVQTDRSAPASRRACADTPLSAHHGEAAGRREAAKLAVKLVFPIFFCVRVAICRHHRSGDDAPRAI